MSKIIYIRDDLGHAWFFDGKRIKMLAAELDGTEDNGYHCNDFEHGVQLLNEWGYISGFDEPSSQPPTVLGKGIT